MYPLCKTSLPASHRHVLDNKTILVIGDEQISWTWIRTTLKNYGIKLVLVQSKPNTFSSEDVYSYIKYDFTEHRQDEVHAERIIDKLSDADLSIDGCCTFTDICGPIAAFVCEKLKLTGGVGVTGATNAWKKNSTHIYLQKQTDGVHHFPRTNKYTGRVAKFICKVTLSSAIWTVGFPAICKPEHGADGDGVVLIRDEEGWHHLNKTLDTLLDDGNPMMLMEYFDGTEHDIEVIIYQGEILAALVSDNGPTRPGSFMETSMSMPSGLPQPLVSQLGTAASHCCIDIGLRNVVFNVEMKLTSTGPGLLEINGRMGGDYIRNWIYLCYRIDLLWFPVSPPNITM
ncbi:carnosine synthase 1-like [Mizuhopecten yessoensis]|uniref:carnosine synthase 1-like n=1 Tax=Mizuhopecten yessoensis TaxID=6573 RepID=UPI000B45A57B|nr:carnosine synthase 1-like [Mizuhopecten yessoensis]